jgi:hypothetical protein
MVVAEICNRKKDLWNVYYAWEEEEGGAAADRANDDAMMGRMDGRLPACTLAK